jgi:hypothetical protein
LPTPRIFRSKESKKAVSCFHDSSISMINHRFQDISHS